MLGIIGAMEIEIRILVEKLKGRSEQNVGGIDFFTGELNGCEAVIAKCGAGKVSAAVCAQLMITRFGADKLINTGVAGGLLASLRQMDTVVANGFVQHDIDTTAIGDEAGLVSGLGEVLLPSSDKLTELLAACAGEKTVLGIIATGDQFIADKERSAAIRERFGAIACDMEGGAIAQVCRMNGVQLAAARCISDNADGSAEMSYGAFAPLAARRCAELVIDFAGRLSA